MKQNQKGVTLIALVVTIIVLLILAGASIAMLSGDNGILTNAQKAQAGNKEGEIAEKMGIAYNTVKTEAMIKLTGENYQPNAATNVEALAKTAAKELGLSESDVTTTIATPVTDGKYHVSYSVGATESTITIIFGDSKFALAPVTTEGTYPQSGKYPNLKAVIKLTATGASYETPTRSAK